MLRVPICSMSACSATTSTSAASSTSVTTGSPTSSRTSARMRSPSTPRPWKAYGDVRGLYAPPRSSVAPARLAMQADSSVCSAVSTAHGPAMKVNVSGPIGTPPTRTVVRSRVVLRRHQLVRRGDAHRLDDAGQPVGVEGLEHVLGADDADDRAHDAAADERLPAVRLDVRDDAGDVGVGGAGAITMTMRRSLSSVRSLTRRRGRRRARRAADSRRSAAERPGSTPTTRLRVLLAEHRCRCHLQAELLELAASASDTRLERLGDAGIVTNSGPLRDRDGDRAAVRRAGRPASR